MRKICGTVLAATMMFALACTPASAVSKSQHAPSQPKGGWICLIYPPRCW